jgi:hypothetical protein
VAQEAFIDGNKINDDRPLAVEQQGTVTATVAGGAVAGPGHPTIDSYTTVKIDLAASTANQ